MIDALYYGSGFILYVVMTMLTINVYNKRTTKNPSVFPIYFIYIYYTLLASYVINFVDGDEIFLVKFAQMAIYAIAAGVFLFIHYKYILEEINYKDHKEGSF